MKLEVGKFYKTRSGEKVEILCVDRLGPFSVVGLIDKEALFSCTEEGSVSLYSSEYPHDIVVEWREPIKVEAWMNIYSDASRQLFFHKESADAISVNRVACIKLTGTEGVD